MIGFRRQTVEHSGKEHKSQPPTEGGSTINTNTGKIGSMDITPSCYALHVSRVFEHLFYLTLYTYIDKILSMRKVRLQARNMGGGHFFAEQNLIYIQKN